MGESPPAVSIESPHFSETASAEPVAIGISTAAEMIWSQESRLQLPPVVAARKALAEGDLIVSGQHAQQALAQNAWLPPPMLLIAQLHLADGRWSKGNLALRHAAAQDKTHPELYLTCGQLALAQGRNLDAWVHLEKALNTTFPETWSQQQRQQLQVMCYHGLASVAERDKDWAVAASILEKWSQLQPPDAALLGRWGKVLFLSGEHEEAEKKFRQSHELSQSTNPPELAMAALFVTVGDLQSAEKLYQKALEKYASDGRVYYEYGGALLVAGRCREASENLEKALEIGSDVAGFATNVTVMRGLVARSLKNYEQAEELFTQVLRERPGHFQATAQLPLVLVQQQDDAKRQRALQAATILAEKYSQSPHALTAAGWVYYRMGRLEEAEQMLKQACAGDTVEPESVYYLAQILVDRRKLSEAKLMVEALKSAVTEPGLFIQREEAQEWLENTSLLLQ